MRCFSCGKIVLYFFSYFWFKFLKSIWIILNIIDSIADRPSQINHVANRIYLIQIALYITIPHSTSNIKYETGVKIQSEWSFLNIYFSLILEMWTVYCVKTAILLNNSSVIQQRCMILPEMADAECRIQQNSCTGHIRWNA